jgi:hypothetical protein
MANASKCQQTAANNFGQYLADQNEFAASKC